MEKPLVLGVDIGGSHITAALVDLEERRIIPSSYIRNPVNAQEDSDSILNSWCEVINLSWKSSAITEKRIGIAMPGPFDYTNGICLIKEQGKFKSLYQMNLRSELAQRLNIPEPNIQFINDAAGFLQGEVFCGAAKSTAKVLGLTLGTGLGTALYINGLTSDAALWNSVFLDGIAEDYLSTRWFVNRYHELSGKNIEGVRDLMPVGDEDPVSLRIFGEFGHNLARFMIPVINQYKLETVILGGSISLAFDAFSGELRSVLKSKQVQAAVKPTALQDIAALIGAASCFEANVRSNPDNKINQIPIKKQI